MEKALTGLETATDSLAEKIGKLKKEVKELLESMKGSTTQRIRWVAYVSLIVLAIVWVSLILSAGSAGACR